MSETRHSRSAWKFRAVATGGLILLLLFLLSAVLQRQSGAWESEFGAHPDEAAHYVTGLMLRDYLTHGFPGNPLAFAKKYYEHYPKVALGHYPPGYYIVEGGWLLLFGSSRSSALLLQCALSATAGLLIYLIARRFAGGWGAFGSAVLFVALPQVQATAVLVMSDLLVAIFCTAAAWAWGKYLQSDRLWYSLGYGICAAAAILTKGSGLLLALIPAMTLCLPGRFTLLRRPSFWVAAVPVLLICVPWMVLTYKITQEGMADQPMLEYLKNSIPYYASRMGRVFGPVILAGALAGIWMHRKQLRSGDGVLFATVSLLPATLIFYSLVPSGFDPRYLLPAAPALVIFFVLALARLATTGRAWLAAAGFLATVASYWFLPYGPVAEKQFSGFREAADYIRAQGAPSERILVASDARGEGAFIAEMAMRDRKISWTVLRGSKELASSDWLGREYEQRKETGEELLKALETEGMEWIVMDKGTPRKDSSRHVESLSSALEAADQRIYEKLRSGRAVRGEEEAEVMVYRLIH
jgi:hypothetical protein